MWLGYRRKDQYQGHQYRNLHWFLRVGWPNINYHWPQLSCRIWIESNIVGSMYLEHRSIHEELTFLEAMIILCTLFEKEMQNGNVKTQMKDSSSVGLWLTYLRFSLDLVVCWEVIQCWFRVCFPLSFLKRIFFIYSCLHIEEFTKLDLALQIKHI